MLTGKQLFDNRVSTDIKVKWPFEKLREEAIDEAVEYIKKLKGPKPAVIGTGWWKQALTEIKVKGLCLEFGVWKGDSLNFFSGEMPNKTWYGFDSFQGLQEHWVGGLHGKKWFDEKGIAPKVNTNVVLVKGWFKNTLPKFFKKNKDKIAFIHIDCDTYESTKDVLDNIPIDRIQKGAIILLDDYISYWGWKENVYKAFQEWILKNRLKYHYQVFGLKSAQVIIK